MSQAEFDSIISEYVNEKLMLELTDQEVKEMWLAIKIGPAMSRDALLNAIRPHIGKTTWIHDDPQAKPHIIFPDRRPQEEKWQETKDLLVGNPKPKETRAPDPKRYEIPCKFDDKQKPIIPDQDDLFSYFKNNFKFAVIRDNAAKGQDLLVEWNRLYKLDGQVLIRQILTANFPAMKQGEIAEVVGAIRNNSPIFRDEFDQNPMILNCKNTLVDLESGRAIDDPTYKSLLQIDTDFRPELGESELWLNALKEACPDGWEIILDFLACGLTRGAISPGKALVLVGEGANGKSTVLEAIRALYGPGNVSTNDMYEIQEKHGAADLVNKFANISTEMPSANSPLTWERIKKIITLDALRVRPLYQPGYSTVIFAQLMFACNDLPARPVVSFSVDRRFIIMEFNKTFPPDDSFRASLQTQEEKSRILNTLWGRLKAIQANGNQPCHTQPIEETAKLWQFDPLELFIDQHIQPTDSTLGPTMQEVNQAYIKFCKALNRPHKTIWALNAKIREAGYGHTNRDGSRHWQNLELVESDQIPGQTTL